MDKIIVTGCNGQLGRAINKELGATGKFEIVNTDVFEGEGIIPLDITNVDSVLKLVRDVKPKTIINCAAYTAVDKQESDIDLSYKINAIGPRNLAIAATEVGAKLVHVSTDYVFEGESAKPYLPDSKTNPINAYGLTKWMGEEAVRIVKTLGYDGIDLDWEYPCVPSNGQDTCPEDKYRFTELLRVLRAHLDSAGDGYLLTIAAGADLYYAESTELDKLSQYLDYINVMTYDLKCGFHALAGHHTQLFSSTGDVFRNSCDQALRLFHAYGVPKEKLLLGAASYSRKAEGLKDRNHGLLQIAPKAMGYGPGYLDIKENYIGKNGYVRYWDDEAKAPWVFNGSTFISYDDPESMTCKAQYVLDNDFGGVFYWDHNSKNTRELLDALYAVLK